MEKKKQKKNYSAPKCEIVHVNETTYLMDTSYPGQHNPAQPGGTSGDAKKAFDGWTKTKMRMKLHHGKTNRK